MISIVIPCYNDNEVVVRAMRSALNQKYQDIEVILVDDGSTTPVKPLPGVKLVRHKHNRGLSAALNTGIERSCGERFVILAADDELHPSYMSTISEYDADIVSCDMLVNGKPVKAKAGSLEELIHHNCHSYAALMKKWVWRATGGFKLTMNPSWEDYEFFLNAAKVGAKWYHVSRPLHIYHRNPVGRDASAQGKERLLQGKLMGYHNDLFGLGRGLVTFVIPCYNHEEFVADAVRSALAQTYPHTNAVVVDDGSPGNVAQALEDVDCDRVVLVRQDNRHLSGARNTGIAYALQRFGSEYLVMLDADDAVHKDFVELTMASMAGDEYVYTDVKFIGDAYHTVEMEEFDCATLTRKHIHPCTFLVQSDMWTDLVRLRGYGYDEDMKQGYEDWEFSVACVEAGWCGKRLPGPYFYYRYHKNGSMRTQAKKINDKLVNYICGKHPWMRNKEVMRDMCTSCGGGGKFSKASSLKGGMGSMFVPGVGDLAPDEPLLVLYTGNTMSTITKVGAGGQIYKFSADPTKQARGYGPQLTVYARDAHLFSGPFKIKRLRPDAQLPQVAASPLAQRRQVEVVDIKQPAQEPIPMPIESPPVAEEPEELDLEGSVKGIELEPEDFTIIKGIGEAGHNKLVEAGFTIYEDLRDANPAELAMVLGAGVSIKKAEAMQAEAAKLIKELEVEDGQS